MTFEKIKEICYQPGHLRTGNKAVKELHKITEKIISNQDEWAAL